LAAAGSFLIELTGAVGGVVELCRETCAYFDYCGGGAPVNKYFENGRFDSTETMFCRFSKQAIFDVVLNKVESRISCGLAAKALRPAIH
jgi:uncharacterized protein